MKFDICDYDDEDLTACWAIDAGKTYIHFTHSISELISLRARLDRMIAQLKKMQKEAEQKHRIAKKGG